MGHHDDTRGKKSFSELDKARREKKHRRDDTSPGQSRRERSQAYSSYKRDLNKIFDGGGLPDLLKEKLADTEVGQQSKAKKEALQAITDASSRRKMLAALKSFEEVHGFPEDEATLTKLLEFDDEDAILLKALQGLESLLAEDVLKRRSAVKMRVKSLQMTADDDDVADAATALAKKL